MSGRRVRKVTQDSKEQRVSSSSGRGETWAGQSMAEWRERGYVPDSDDEEEEELQIQPSQKYLSEETSKVPSRRVDVAVSTENFNQTQVTNKNGAAYQASGSVANDPRPLSLSSPLKSGNAITVSFISSQGTQNGTGRVLKSSKNKGILRSRSTSPVAEQLQAVLDLGLQQVGNVLGKPTRPERPNDTGCSLSSSPLSSLDSVDGLKDLRDVERFSLSANEKQQSTLPERNYLIPTKYSAFAPQRELRQRNPIQIRPYALEDALYQKEFKDRGLKPVRTGYSETIPPFVATDPNRDDTGLLSSSPFEDSGPATGSFIVGEENINQGDDLDLVDAERPFAPSHGVDGDDELPDIAAILRGDKIVLRSKKRSNANRRQRSDQVSQTRPMNAQFNVYDLPKEDAATYDTLPGEARFIIPPSPPHSGSPMSENDLPAASKKTSYADNTPRRLPTPLISSEAQSRKRSVTEVLDSSPDQLGPDLVNRSPSSSSSESDREKARRIKQMRKKMRGVLPASWLKLDLTKQTATEASQLSPDLPSGLSGGKGVAHRVAFKKHSSPTSEIRPGSRSRLSDLNSSDDGDSSNYEGATSTKTRTYSFEADAPDYWMEDAVEDNHIDAMVPSGTRRPFSTIKTAKKRQQRIHDTWGAVSNVLRGTSNSSKAKFSGIVSAAHQRNSAKRKHKRRKKEHSLPKLSVLDAPDFAQLRRDEQPKFLRVAGRKAQTSTNRVSQDPKRKYFRLETVKDTQDINDSLVLWRAGRLEQRQKSRSTLEIHANHTNLRLPISQGSALTLQLPISNGSNGQSRTQTKDTDDFHALKRTTNSTIQRILFRQRGLIGLSQSDNSLSIGNHEDTTPSTRGRFTLSPLNSLQNRSGKGNFQRTAPLPRLAQLEKTRPTQSTSKFPHGLEYSHPPTNANIEVLSPATFGPPRSRAEPVIDHTSTSPSSVNALQREPVRRPPRKRVPKYRPVTQRLDVGGLHLVLGSASPNLPERTLEDDKITRATFNDIANMRPLSPGIAYNEATLIGSGTLRKIERTLVLTTREANKKSNPTVSQARNLDKPSALEKHILHPETRVPILCGQWSAELATQLTSAFDFIPGLLDKLGTYTYGLLEPPALKGPTRRIIFFLDEIVEYQYHSLYFEEPEHRQRYIVTSSAILERFSRVIRTWRDLKNPLVAFNMQHVLNRMVLYAFEVAAISSVSGVSKQIQKKSWDLFKIASADALRLALSQTDEEGNPTWVQSRPLNPSQLCNIGIEHPEIDAIVIVNSLSSISVMNDECATSFNDILACYLKPEQDDGKPVMKLLAVISALCKALPFTEINIDGKLAERVEVGVGGMRDCWSVLIPPLSNWLRRYVKAGHARTPNDKRLGRAIFRWSLHLANEWRIGSVPDELIRAMNWAYVNNNMKELFDDPNTSSKTYLHQFQLLTVRGQPEDNEDTDFVIFCKLLAKNLQEKYREVENSSEVKVGDRVRSFVNRLYPNTGPPLLESNQIRMEDLSLLWNRCGLYVTLFTWSWESMRPRLSQIQDLVDFSTSHLAACFLLLRLWENLTHTAMATDSELTEIAGWMHNMLNQMISKWHRAKTEVVDQFALLNKTPDQRALDVIEINQRVVVGFLVDALDRWNKVLIESPSLWHSAGLLGINDEGFELLIRLFLQHFASDNFVMAKLIGLFDTCLSSWAVLIPAALLRVIQIALKQLLSHHLNTSSTHTADHSSMIYMPHSDFMVQVTNCWFRFANIAVRTRNYTWDDFLESAGRCSWELFGDYKQSAVYKVLFVSKMFSCAPDEYDGKRLWFLKYWITAILQPFSEWKFQHLLTTELLQKDVYNKLLFNLPLLMQNNENAYSVSLFELTEVRMEVVLQIVENIGTHDDDDSQADLYALQADDLAQILTAMMRTMKTGYRQVHQTQTNAPWEYDSMVSRVIETMGRRTSHLCAIDPWFLDGKEFQSFRLPQSVRLAGDGSEAMGELVISKADVTWFQLTSQRAATETSQAELAEILKKIYVGVTSLKASKMGKNVVSCVEEQISVVKQVAMMQQVFPAYIERALTDPGAIIAAPLLESLPEICRHLARRAMIVDSVDYTPILEALYAIIAASRTCLETVQPLYIWTSCTRMKTFSCVLNISHMAFMQYFQICDLPGRHRDHANIPDVMEYARIIYLFACQVGSRPPLNVPFDEPRILEGKNDSISARRDPVLSNPEAKKIQDYARTELGKALDESWTMDGKGQIWVRQGRDAVQVTGDLVAGLEDQEVEQMVLQQVELFIRMYVDLQPGLSHPAERELMEILTL